MSSFRNPLCTHDAAECRMTSTTRIQEPLIEWAPIYDGNGRQTNADPNTIIIAYSCSVCGMKWEREINADDPPTETPMQ